MSYDSGLTRQSVLDCAKQEFMEHGYQAANMRSIAKKANVTTGAMYNHFANKAVLFDALVQAPAEDMLAQFKKIHKQAMQAAELNAVDSLGQKSLDGTDWMLDFIYEHMDAFRLIFCRSEGTRWSSYLEELIEVEETTQRVCFDMLSANGKHVDDFFLHVSAAVGFQYFVEIVSHDLPYERAASVMDNVKRTSMAGWKELLGV